MADKKLVIDNSILQTLKDCPYKCYLRYFKHLVLKSDANLFKPEFGVAIHAGMESWYKEKDIKKMEDAFIRSWARFDGQDKTMVRTMERGLIALKKYRDKFLDEPITANPDMIEIGGSIDVEDFIFCFRIDAIVKWGGWDGYYLMEYKTSVYKNTVCTKPNAQVEGYTFGAAAITGFKINGCIWNFFHFRKGRSGEKIENTVEITREMIDISEQQLELWRKDFIYWASTLQDCLEKEKFARNTGMCFSYGRCPYLPICEMGGSLPAQGLLNTMYEEKKWQPFHGAIRE